MQDPANMLGDVMRHVDDRKPAWSQTLVCKTPSCQRSQAASWSLFGCQGSVQASTVYQFQSIETLQCELDPMLIRIELVAVGAWEVVMEDMSILRR
jgi:hypothetical protein